MKANKNFKILFAIILCFSQVVFAGGTHRSSMFGAKTNALGGMYYAGIDGLSNSYLNPAGLSFLDGRSFEFSAFIKSEENTFESKLSGLHRSFYEDDVNGGLGFYWSLGEGFTVAFSFESIYDYRVNWPYVLVSTRGTTSDVSASDMSCQIQYNNFTPAVGYKLGSLAVGLAANIISVNEKISFAQSNYDWFETGNNLPVYQMDLSNDGLIWNLNLGLMYRLNEDWRIGLTLSNGAEEKLSGDAKSKMFEEVDSLYGSTGSESNYQIPWTIGVGCVYRLNEILTFNLDMKYSLYKNLDEVIEYTFDNKTLQNKYSPVDSITGYSSGQVPQYFDNSIDIAAGVDIKAYDDFNVLLGYRYSASPNSEKTYSMLNPSVNQHMFSLGFSYFDEEFILDGSVVYYTGKEKSITENPVALHNGIYDAQGFIPGLTIKYKF